METHNIIRQKDLEKIAQSDIFLQYKEKTILITGATGLVGSELVLSLLCANRINNLDINVVALVRNYEKALNIFGEVINNPNLKIIVQDINEKISCAEHVDYVVHTASITTSKYFVEKPVETIMTTVNGTKNALEFAVDNKVKDVVYISSLEMYGIIKSEDLVKENQTGSVDVLNVRSCYPEAKRMAENLCIAYSKEHNLNVKIARLTQTYGAGFSLSENRAFAQFVKSAILGEDIVLFTDGKSSKNYCYIADAILAILYILLKGNSTEAYNVANKDSIKSIGEIASLVANISNVKVRYESDSKDRGYLPNIKLALDSTKLEQLGWKPMYSIEEGLKNTLLYARDEKNIEHKLEKE